MSESHHHTSQVSFIRHTFRGLETSPIITGVTTIDFGSLTLPIPPVIAQQYQTEEVSCGLNARARAIVNDTRKVKNVLVDLTTRRTYATGRAIALANCSSSVSGAPTSDSLKDAVVVQPNDLSPPIPPDPSAIVAKANQLKAEAHMILQDLLHALRLDTVVITPTPVTDPLLALLDLPDWSLQLADLAQMICGIHGESPSCILTKSGWPEPRSPRKILRLGARFWGIYLAVGAAGAYQLAAGTAAAYTVATLGQVGTYFAVTHDINLEVIYMSLGFSDAFYSVWPTQQLIFKQDGPDNVKVYTVRPQIDKDGRASNTHLKKKFNGEISLALLQTLAENARPQPVRIKIPVTEKCFDN